MVLRKVQKIQAFLILFLILVPALTWAKDYSAPQELVDRSVIVVRRFMSDPQMAWLQKHVHEAKAIMIIPQLLKGGFFLGGSGGSGVLLVRDPGFGWSYPAFYVVGSVSLGLQFGGEVSEAILLIMTQKGVQAFLSTSFKLGGDVSVAAGPVGVGAKAQTADVLVFAYSKGAFAGISVEGALIKPRNSWNQLYYGRKVSPREILILHKVKNHGADKLRLLLSRFSRD